MQVLYQLSYSPERVFRGFPRGDANITRSTGWNTKSFRWGREGRRQAVTNE